MIGPLGTAVIATVAILTLWRAARSDVKAQGEWKGRMDEWKEAATKQLERIEKTLSGLLLPRPQVITTDSPFKLNALGEQVWTELDAETWLDRHAREAPRAKNMGDYDLQEFCFNYVATLDLEPRWRNLVRQAAYRNGLTEAQVRQIMAIKLRDTLAHD